MKKIQKIFCIKMKRHRNDEKNEEVPELPRRFLKRQFNKNYDDKSFQADVMNMSVEERQHYFNTAVNPFGYPQEYYEIYEREKMIRNPAGFDHLLNIDDVMLFEKKSDQFVSKTRIQQFLNVNCIKSRHTDNLELEDVVFGAETVEKLRSVGIDYLGTSEEYYNARVGDYIQHDADIRELMSDDIGAMFEEYKQDAEAEGEEVGDEMYGDYANNFYEENLEEYEYIFRENCELEYNEKLALKAGPDPNKYRIIVELIKESFGELAQFVCIAGGFSLSMYIYEKYGYSVNFNDIDLFIHSCDQDTANLIVQRLSDITGSEIRENENVVVSNFNTTRYNTWDSYQENEFNKTNRKISFLNKIKTIQIIKRLYTSPSQIIHGFDVDSCCILTTLDGNTFITERGAHALKNGYNVLNFERFSPSNEYRLMKYLMRGFGLWIPFAEFFKRNCVFDYQNIDRGKLSSVVIMKLMGIIFKKTSRENVEKDISDYYSYENNSSPYENDYIEFKTLNPDEQIINTFHRVVLDDIKEWYPVRQQGVFDHISINDFSLEMNKVEVIKANPYASAMNILKNKKAAFFSDRGQTSCQEILNYANIILPESSMTGNIVLRALSGITHRDKKEINKLKIYSSEMSDNSNRALFRFELQKYVYLISFRNTYLKLFPEFAEVENCNLFGRIIFINKVEDTPYISEEQNFINFKNADPNIYETVSIFESEAKNKSKILFVPSDETIKIFNQYREKIYSEIGDLNFADYCTDKLPIYEFKNQKETFHLTTIEHFLRVDKLVFISVYQILHFLSSAFNDSEFYNVKARVFDQISIMYRERQYEIESENDMGNTKSSTCVFDVNLIYSVLSEEEIYTVKMYLTNKHLKKFTGRKIYLEFSDTGDEEDFIDNAVYQNGEYFASDYDYNLFKAGITHKDITDKNVIVYDSPVYDQFFPN